MPRLLLLVDAGPLPAGFATLGSCEVHEHALYAVEKWFVDRTRPVSLLVVYTGHADHSVSLDVCHTDDLALFDRTLAALRADGAKPKQTEHGTLMVTSLAHFRSDYTIVPIPAGRFLPAVRDQLYASIDLLRIGASGRTALTLEDPTEATRERFASTYHIPSPDIVQAVLRLVALVQSALAIFGLYPHPIDGLLCDATLSAIKRWSATIGIRCLGLSPPPDKPVPDPAFVAALFSLVLSSRNRLADLGYPLPSDPFSRPSAFFPVLSLEIVQAISSKQPFINPTTDLASFVSQILSPPSSLSSSHPRDQSDSDHLNSLASLRALWAPSVVFPRSRRSRPSSRLQNSRGGVASDGDGEHNSHSNSLRRYFDGTEEDSDVPRHAFRWKGKLGSWAGLAKRKHQSVDLSPTSSLSSSLRKTAHPSLASVLPPIPPPKDKSKGKISKLSQSLPQSRTSTLRHESTPSLSLSTTYNVLSLAVPTRSQSYNTSRRRGHPPPPPRRSTIANVPEKANVDQNNNNARAQSPTLPPMSFFGDPEDDDLLSSGQVSPLSDRPNPFHLYHQSPVQYTPPLQLQLPSSSSTRPSLSSRQNSHNNTNTNQNLLVVPPNPNLNPPTTIDGKILSKLLLDSKQKQKQKKKRYHHYSHLGPPNPQARIASWAGPDGGSAWGGGGGEAAEAETEPDGGEDENENEELEEQESDASWMYHAVSGSGPAGPPLPNKGDALRPIRVARGAAAAAAVGMPTATTGRGGGAKPASSSAWLRKKEKARFHSLLSVVDRDGQPHEEVALGVGINGGGVGSGSEDGEIEVEWYRDEGGERGVEHEDEEDEEDDDEGDEEGGEEEEEEFDEEEEERMEVLRRRMRAFDPRRRRSFHDLDTFREVDVLSPERMKIDVELCGQCLIMRRREKHLQNVLDCVHHISTSLSTSNTSLRTHFSKQHTPSHLSSLTSQSSLRMLPIPATDEMAQKSDRYAQGTNVLLYETKQFGVKELWAGASAMRRKVWDLREGVFGAGGGGANNANTSGDEQQQQQQQQQQRRPPHHLPPGVHGAHGSFNRLQWRLDGRSVLVDQLGRTESEAEEEALLDAELLEISGTGSATTGGGGSGGLADGAAAATAASASAAAPLAALPSGAVSSGRRVITIIGEDSEDSEDVVESHPGIKPVWLLNFFTSWRARWSAVAAAAPTTITTSSSSAAAAATATTGETGTTPVLSTVAGAGDEAETTTVASAVVGASTPLLNSRVAVDSNVGGGADTDEITLSAAKEEESIHGLAPMTVEALEKQR